MIFLNSALHELGEIDLDVDAEFGTSEAPNDFEFATSLKDLEEPGAFYIPGTEIGGLIDYNKTKSDQDVITFKGYLWRGLLAQNIIMPPTGSDYMTVSGEANSVISSLLTNVMGNLFTVSSEDSGLTVSNYQFPLYINLLDGIEGMLESYGYRLKITAQKIASNQPIQILVEATEATVISGTYNEDNGIPLTYEINRMGINHLICGGSGELQNREIVHLYINDQGEISQTQYYTGIDERQEFFDYPNAESTQDLIDYGTERLKEVASFKKLSIKAPEDQTLEIGDIVRGVFPDGSVIQSPVISKIYKIKNGLLYTECKVKGEE